jgi:hypothetical protein
LKHVQAPSSLPPLTFVVLEDLIQLHTFRMSGGVAAASHRPDTAATLFAKGWCP